MVGTAEAVAAAARHPLARALRIDKLSLAALEATLALYRDPERARARDPGAGDARGRPPRRCSAARERLAAAIGGEVVEAVAKVGGGALPLLELEGPAVALPGARAPDATAARLRAGDPPVLARIQDGPRAAGPAHDGRRGGRRGAAASRGASSAAPLTLGTAGHIDHGKTALVARADRRRHRPAAGGAAARDLDRARLRAARAAERPAAVRRRRAGARALRAHDGRRARPGSTCSCWSSPPTTA